MFTTDALKHALIWDFPDATTLNFANWAGAVLAPNATVTNIAPIEGTLYAQDFAGNGELHNFNYTGPLGDPVPAAVPEPGSFVLLAGGVAAALGVRGVGRAGGHTGRRRFARGAAARSA